MDAVEGSDGERARARPCVLVVGQAHFGAKPRSAQADLDRQRAVALGGDRHRHPGAVDQQDRTVQPARRERATVGRGACLRLVEREHRREARPGRGEVRQRRNALPRPRPVDLERPDREPPQLQAVGVAERGDERTHVGAGGADKPQARPVAVAPQQARLVHRDLALGGLHILPAARTLVGALAVDLHRRVGRRALAQTAERQGERVRHDARPRDLALGIPRRGGGAELDHHLIGLRQRREEAREARGAADQHDQQTRRERVERAGVADAAHTQRAARTGHHVMRAKPRRLVRPQDPRRGLGRRQISARIASISSAVGRSLVKPAARR